MLTVLFGNEIKEEAEGKAAETKGYYLMVEGGERIYSVADYTFKNWQKNESLYFSGREGGSTFGSRSWSIVPQK